MDYCRNLLISFYVNNYFFFDVYDLIMINRNTYTSNIFKFILKN